MASSTLQSCTHRRSIPSWRSDLSSGRCTSPSWPSLWSRNGGSTRRAKTFPRPSGEWTSECRPWSDLSVQYSSPGTKRTQKSVRIQSSYPVPKYTTLEIVDPLYLLEKSMQAWYVLISLLCKYPVTTSVQWWINILSAYTSHSFISPLHASLTNTLYGSTSSDNRQTE